MLRLAYFSPLPPERTGIADYSADLLPYLKECAEIAVFVRDAESVVPALQGEFPVYPLEHFPGARWNYDLSLYQMGNSLFHREIYKMALRYPGVVVMHDCVLHHLVAGITIDQGNFSAYSRELGYAQGLEGVAQAFAVRNRGEPLRLYDWPLNRRLVDLSLGVLVHSDYVRTRLLAEKPDLKVRKVHQPIILPPLVDRSAARERLGLPQDKFILLSCGEVTPYKRLDLVLEAFRLFHERHPDALWVVTGSISPECKPLHQELEEIAARRSGVVLKGYLESMERFYDYLFAADLCVNLRHPTVGETSASALRAMSAGLPVITTNTGWYAELPEDVGSRVVPEGDVAAQLLEILERWYRDGDGRRVAGDCARAYVARACDPRRVARSYCEFIETFCK